MVKESKVYTVVCDNCGTEREDFEWTESLALEFAEDEDWLIEDNKHICPYCITKVQDLLNRANKRIQDNNAN